METTKLGCCTLRYFGLLQISLCSGEKAISTRKRKVLYFYVIVISTKVECYLRPNSYSSEF